MKIRKENKQLKKLSRVLSAVLGIAVLSSSFVTAAGSVSAEGAEASNLKTSIQNGEPLLDNNGEHVQAHGGGFLTVEAGTTVNADGEKVAERTYYWVGEDKEGNSASNNPVHLYRSTDLMNWEDRGLIITSDTLDEDGHKPLVSYKLERPKLLYNENTKKYVLWGHYEFLAGYAASEVLVATADNIEGPYTIQRNEEGEVHFRPGAGNDDPLDFGDRYGAGIEDWDSQISIGGTASEVYPTKPVKSESPLYMELYWDTPSLTKQWVTIVEEGQGNGKDKMTVEQFREATKTDRLPNGIEGIVGRQYTVITEFTDEVRDMVGNDYGVSGMHTGSDWWTYHLNDMHNDFTLKASAVKMDDWDPTFYYLYQDTWMYARDKLVSEGAFASTANTSAGTKDDYLIRYPAEDEKGDVIASETVSSDYEIVETQAEVDPYTQIADPVIHPGLDEAVDDSGAVLVNANDMIFITCPTTWVGDTQNTVTIHYTLDGSTPTTSDPTYSIGWQTNCFSASSENKTNGVIDVGAEKGETFTITVKAFTKDGEKASKVVSQTFRVATDDEEAKVPVFKPVIRFPSGKYTTFGYKELKVFCPTYGAEVYYTVDGTDPVESLPKLGDNLGYGSRDFTVYRDPQTKKAYLITAQDHIYIRVWELNEEYTDVEPQKQYNLYVGMHREAPALVRNGEYVYLFTSDQSGWQPNQGQYARTEDIANGFDCERRDVAELEKYGNDYYLDMELNGTIERHGAFNHKGLKQEERGQSIGYRNGQSGWSELQPFGDNSNYRSQPTRIFDIGTKDDPQFVFMGDRWNSNALGTSTYCFYPLTIENDEKGVMGQPGRATLQYAPEISIDKAEDGTLSVRETNTINLMRQEGVKLTAQSNSLAWNTPYVGVRPPEDSVDEWITSEEQNEAFLQACEDGVGPDGENPADMPYIRYDAEQLIDGVDWDIDNYDEICQFFRGTGYPYLAEFELPAPAKLDWVGISTRVIGGSEGSHGIIIKAKLNAEDNWRTILNNSDTSKQPYGFQEGDVEGVYQYLRLEVTGNSKGDWASGVYEFQVGGEPIDTNTSELQAALDTAKEILQNDANKYTLQSLFNLNNVVIETEDLLASGATTQTTIKECLDALNNAMAALEEVAQKPTVDKTKLFEAYVKAAALDEGDYTKESWEESNIEAVMANAEAILQAQDATAQQVEDAANALNAAMDILVKVENPGGDEPGGNEPGGDEPGGNEPGGNEPGGNEPGGNEPGGNEPGGNEPGGNEPGSNEPGGNEPGGNEPGDNETPTTGSSPLLPLGVLVVLAGGSMLALKRRSR